MRLWRNHGNWRFCEFMIIWWAEFSGTMVKQQKSFQQVRKIVQSTHLVLLTFFGCHWKKFLEIRKSAWSWSTNWRICRSRGNWIMTCLAAMIFVSFSSILPKGNVSFMVEHFFSADLFRFTLKNHNAHLWSEIYGMQPRQSTKSN